MKRKSSVIVALVLCLTAILSACGNGEANNPPPPEPEKYSYTAAADEGLTLYAKAGDTELSSGAQIAEGTRITVDASAQSGTVRVYVNNKNVRLPHTFTVTENVSVRAELWYSVTVKVNSPYDLSPSAVTLKENGFDAELNEDFEYVGGARAGGELTYTASAAGFASVQKTVTVTGDARVELSIDTPVMTAWGVIRQSDDGTYEIVRNESLSDTEAGDVSGATAFEAIPDTHWVFSYKLKDITGGAWNMVSVGAIFDTQGSTSMNLYYADGRARLETLTLQPNWTHREYEAQSSIDLNEALNGARKGSDGYLRLEFVRDNDTAYMFVNGSYVLAVDLDSLGAENDISDRATAFGIFSRANMGGVAYDVSYERGEEAVAARLAEGKVQLEISGENAAVQAPQTAYDGQETEITFTPDLGYMIESVVVDGEDALERVQTAGNGYKLTVYAHEGLTVEIVCKPVPVMYAVTGRINVKTYNILPADITATANNLQPVQIDEQYNYTVQAEAGELTLSFAAENFVTVTRTVSVTEEGAVLDIDLDEPVLTSWSDTLQKTGKNEYTVSGSQYNTAGFMAAASKYWTIEAKIKNLDAEGKTDFALGFLIGDGSPAINVCYYNGLYQLEAIAVSPVWALSHTSASKNIDEAMKSGNFTLKAVRADKVLAIYMNGNYLGSFLTDEYAGVNIDAAGAGIAGLFTRGDIGCVFYDVWYDLDEDAAKSAIAEIEPEYGTETITPTNAVLSADGSISIAPAENGSNWMGAKYSSATRYWIMETKLSVSEGGGWFFAGISVRDAGWNNIDLHYEAGNVTLKAYAGQSATAIQTNPEADLSAAMAAAMQDEGYLTFKVMRANEKCYVYVNGEMIATADISALGIESNDAATFGLHMVGACTCKFYDMRYTADAVAVMRALEEIQNNA